MKKEFVILLMTACILTGCAGSAPETEPSATASVVETAADDGKDAALAADDGKNEERPEDAPSAAESAQIQETEEEAAFPGSYTVPEGWVEAEAHSTAEKIFFTEEGHENDLRPDNISIEVGKNRYKADEHEQFREAILRQLLMQTQGLSAELTGSGSYTDQGYVLYTFTIKGSDITTVQYYIVDDYRYCLIHLTNFSEAEGACEAAQALADSFVWAEE